MKILILESTIEDVELPKKLKELKEKAKSFKNPKFVALSQGSIAYHVTWNELIHKVKEWRKWNYDENRINKNLANYDVYGSKKPKSIQSLLHKQYHHPQDVPKEVYDHIQKHSSLLYSDASDAVRWSRIINTKNDARYSGKITIYRAVETQFNSIREGDWVTTDKDYAIQHNEKYFDGKGKILSMEVDGEDVLVSPTGNYEEAIYAPLKYSGKI